MKMRYLPALFITLVSLIPFSGALAQGTLLRIDYPPSYTVGEGDSLWNIAGQFLQDPERWPEIWEPDPYLDDSDLIFPGDILSLNFVGGNPRIMVKRGDREEQRLGPRVREEMLSSSIPAIPLEAIENSFTRNRIISEELFEQAPYIVENLGSNLAIATGDEVYARGTWPTTTSSFEVYRAGRVYTGQSDDVEAVVEDPPWWRVDRMFRNIGDPEVVLGMEAEYLGFATIVANEGGDLRRLLVNNSSKEIRVGDRLLIRQQERIDATIFPTEPAMEVDGRIIAFLSGEAMASQLDTAVVNLGERDNLAIGNVLAVRAEGSTLVDDVNRSRMTFRQRMSAVFSGERLELPGEETGTLLVYKTFERFSYAVILSSLQPIELFAEVTNP